MQHNDNDSPAADIKVAFTSALRRHWRISLSPALAVFTLTLVVLFGWPDYYTTNSLIFIQPQRLTSKIVENQTYDEMRERLDGLVQEILTRSRLRTVIERFDLYPDLRGVKGKEKAIEKFRNAIVIAPVQSQTGAVNQAAQTFSLQFTHVSRELSYEVTKTLVNLFIEESVISRRSEIEGTLEFLDAQLLDARKKLESTEEDVQKFERENFGKLPEQHENSIALLSNAQAQLASNAEIMAAQSTRRGNLMAELSDLRRGGGFSDASGGVSGSPRDQLAQLESALTVLRSKYSDVHPDVVSVRQRIASLRAAMQSAPAPKTPAAGTGGGDAIVGNGPNASMARALKREIGDIDVQISALNKENERLKNTVAKLEADITEMPLREQEMIKIRRNYANVKDSYDKLLAAREDAALQSSAARSQRSSQFRVVEPAEVPVLPAGPNRWLIGGGGILLSVLIFFGVPFAMFQLSSAFKFSSELENEMALPVIGVIPPMNSPQVALAARMVNARIKYLSIGFFAVGSLLVVVLVKALT